MAFKDYRDKAQRTSLELMAPFWACSKEMNYNDANLNTDFVLFSFPAAPLVGRVMYCIHEVILDVVAVFDDTPTLTLGLGTLPLDTTIESGTLSVVDADEHINNTTAALTASGRKYPTSSEDWLAGELAKFIVGADATVPVIYADIGTAGQAATVGSMFVYLLMSRISYK